MKILDLIQGSKEWLDHRKKCVTATDIAIINGTNTFKRNSAFKLWKRKLNFLPEEELNEYMMEGTRLEPEARKWFNENYKCNLQPVVGVDEENEWMLASFDGFDHDERFNLEIKCGKKAYELAQESNIAPYTFDQIQYGLKISKKEWTNCLFYRPDQTPIVIQVYPNGDHQINLYQKAAEFISNLHSMTPPPLSENDYVLIENEKANEKAKNWHEAKDAFERAKTYLDVCKDELLNETDDGNCIFPFANVKVQRINSKGTIDWKKVCKKWNISDNELEVYRKQSIGYPKITVITDK